MCSILFVSCHYSRNATYAARPARPARMMGGSPPDFSKLFEIAETFESHHFSAFPKTGARTIPACALCDRRWPVSAGQTILAEVEDARPFQNHALDTWPLSYSLRPPLPLWSLLCAVAEAVLDAAAAAPFQSRIPHRRFSAPPRPAPAPSMPVSAAPKTPPPRRRQTRWRRRRRRRG